MLDFRSRGLPSLPTIARSVAAMGGILTGIGTGAAFGLLNGSRRTAISSIMALSAEYSLALAGVRVDTIGEQHVWEQRPAVFVFNHQSQLDVFVICYLLRRDFTGVAKQELTKDPIFGPVFRFAGVAFVDRQGGGNPRDALAPAVAKLHDGISVVIAPEGTRSLTPTLGEFKTGAFHLAREAGVPVVPIVIRNAGELMWRDSLTIKPGTVQVAVLPPIDVSAWPADQVRNKTREVQALFADTLAHWPGDPRPAPKDPAPPRRPLQEGRPRQGRSAKKAAAKKTVAKKTVTKKTATKKRRLPRRPRSRRRPSRNDRQVGSAAHGHLVSCLTLSALLPQPRSGRRTIGRGPAKVVGSAWGSAGRLVHESFPTQWRRHRR